MNENSRIAELRRAIESLRQYAEDAAALWNQGSDKSVGHMLQAMAGQLPGFSPSIDAALAAAQPQTASEVETPPPPRPDQKPAPKLAVMVVECVLARRAMSLASVLDGLDLAALDRRIEEAQREIAAAQALKILARQWQAEHGKNEQPAVGSGQVAGSEQPAVGSGQVCFCQKILDAIDAAADGQVNRWVSTGVIAARTKLTRATVLETLADLREHVEMNAEGEVRLKQPEPASATAD